MEVRTGIEMVGVEGVVGVIEAERGAGHIVSLLSTPSFIGFPCTLSNNRFTYCPSYPPENVKKNRISGRYVTVNNNNHVRKLKGIES